MHDLEILAQTRLERDSMHTQYNLLDQKYNKISQENKALRSKIEELKQESRANFEASKHVVPLDKNVKTATGSISRIEVDYYRELENMKKSFEIEIEKLNEEVDWYKAKLETERQWSHSLELANKHLNEQIEDFRKN
jgi:chromosome segregation ATPase